MDNFELYLGLIGGIKKLNEQYCEENKEIVELSIYQMFRNIYNNKEVYRQILNYFYNNCLYERYAKVLFEIQFNPPPQIESENKINDKDLKSDKTSDESKGRTIVKDKKQDVDISKDFIDRLFKEEE